MSGGDLKTSRLGSRNPVHRLPVIASSRIRLERLEHAILVAAESGGMGCGNCPSRVLRLWPRPGSDAAQAARTLSPTTGRRTQAALPPFRSVWRRPGSRQGACGAVLHDRLAAIRHGTTTKAAGVVAGDEASSGARLECSRPMTGLRILDSHQYAVHASSTRRRRETNSAIEDRMHSTIRNNPAEKFLRPGSTVRRLRVLNDHQLDIWLQASYISGELVNNRRLTQKIGESGGLAVRRLRPCRGRQHGDANACITHFTGNQRSCRRRRHSLAWSAGSSR